MEEKRRRWDPGTTYARTVREVLADDETIFLESDEVETKRGTPYKMEIWTYEKEMDYRRIAIWVKTPEGMVEDKLNHTNTEEGKAHALYAMALDTLIKDHFGESAMSVTDKGTIEGEGEHTTLWLEIPKDYAAVAGDFLSNYETSQLVSDWIDIAGGNYCPNTGNAIRDATRVLLDQSTGPSALKDITYSMKGE
jgi:hypothetical protein